MALRNQIQKRALSVSRLVAQTPVTTGEVPPEINPMKKWGSFTWTDPFNLESRLTDDEKMFRDAFRFFLFQNLKPEIEIFYNSLYLDIISFMGTDGLTLDLPYPY